MLELFRSWAIHQARFHQAFLSSWGHPDPDVVDSVLRALVYDGLWLTKFPLLRTPTYGVFELDAVHKAWEAGLRDPDAVPSAAAGIAAIRPRVDADVLRFMLGLTPADLEARVELFFGGRAMNKPLWQYLAAWSEHSAVLRGPLVGPGMLDTAFS